MRTVRYGDLMRDQELAIYTYYDACMAIQEARLKHDHLLSFVRQGQRAKEDGEKKWPSVGRSPFHPG